MTTEQQLYAAVLNDPDNDGPRLDYAAWCDTQSDAAAQERGVFIRQQVELVTPGTQVSHDAVRLRYLSELLLYKHSATWGAAVVPFVDSFQFDRGFIEQVAMSAKKFLDHADALFAIAPIRHLDLSDVRPFIDELLDSPHLQCIRSLSVKRCELDDANMQLLANCTNLAGLRWLSLMENRIGMVGAAAFAASGNFPCLTYAVFNGNPAQLNDEHFHDSGVIVESSSSADGRALEAQFGHLRWLHHAATTLADTVPDRFRVACAAQISA